jgi:hypothetical protein
MLDANTFGVDGTQMARRTRIDDDANRIQCSAEFIPSSFDDLGLHPDMTKYNRKIDDYLRKRGVRGLEYGSDLNRWIFDPLVNDPI